MSVNVSPLIHGNRNARCGMVPNSYLANQLRASANHILEYRHRQVFDASWELGAVVGVSTPTVIRRWRFRTGTNVDRVEIVVLLGACVEIGLATPSPSVEFDFTISGGATTTSDLITAPIATSAADGPDDQATGMVTIAVSESTVYEVAMRVSGYCRVLAVCGYEKAPPDDVFPGFLTAGSPILDVDREEMFVALSNAYRQNGAVSAHWGLGSGAARTRTSATACNLIDGSTTGTPTTAHQGWYIDPRYHRTASRTTVQFQFAVYASMSSGTGSCRLIDSAGNTYGSISINSATPQWWASSTINLPESAEIFIVPQFAGNGINTLSVYAASLIEIDL